MYLLNQIVCIPYDIELDGASYPGYVPAGTLGIVTAWNDVHVTVEIAVTRKPDRWLARCDGNSRMKFNILHDNICTDYVQYYREHFFSA